MANASAGEPLAYRHGVALYSEESVFGTAVTPATTIGNAAISLNKRSSNAYFRGPGSAGYTAAKGGSSFVEWSLRFAALQAHANVKAFLTKAARVSGVVPPITLGFGYSDDQGTPNRSAEQIAGAKIDTLELGLDASGGHGPLSGSVSGIGFPPTTITSLAPATLAEEPWMSYEGVMTRAGAAYEIRSFSMTLANNLSRDHVIPGATPGSNIRAHKYVTEHGIDITGRITRYQTPGVSVLANAISEFAMVLAFTSLTGGQALTLTFADVSFDNESQDIDEGGVFWSCDWRAKSLAVT